MWEPRRLTTLRVSTAYYRDSFTFLQFSAETDYRRKKELVFVMWEHVLFEVRLEFVNITNRYYKLQGLNWQRKCKRMCSVTNTNRDALSSPSLSIIYVLSYVQVYEKKEKKIWENNSLLLFHTT
jgi:hypothetical protein